jgi:hypothetical protein
MLARNTRIHDNSMKPVMSSVQWAVDTAFDLWRAGAEIGPPVKDKPPDSWKAPVGDAVMINVDASFSNSSYSGASRCLMRDAGGNLIQARSRWWASAPNALVMEAFAFRDGEDGR